MDDDKKKELANGIEFLNMLARTCLYNAQCSSWVVGLSSNYQEVGCSTQRYVTDSENFSCFCHQE
jgi:hypothetical protein